jgi:hypothetical protein
MDCPDSSRSTYFFQLMLCLLFLLAACTPLTRHVLITDRNEINFADGNKFYICLQPDEAKQVKGLLNLRTTEDVKKYETTRQTTAGPIEQILFDVVRADYRAAKADMTSRGDRIPTYLQLLLRADLVYLMEGTQASSLQLVQLYQDAFEAQLCDLNRDLIKLRIRQVRYGR